MNNQLIVTVVPCIIECLLCGHTDTIEHPDTTTYLLPPKCGCTHNLTQYTMCSCGARVYNSESHECRVYSTNDMIDFAIMFYEAYISRKGFKPSIPYKLIDNVVRGDSHTRYDRIQRTIKC